VTVAGRPLLFYAQWWPLGRFHNPEAERKVRAFAAAGYAVTYVPGIGIRNPGPSSAAKAVDVVGAKLASVRRGREQQPQPFEPGVSSGAVFALPPRQLGPIRRLNASWMRRQLQGMVEEWDRALAWIRYPTPEVVAALRHLRPAGIVYECVDPYPDSPGMLGAWRDRLLAAERELLTQAQVAVTPTEALADRLRSAGAADVRVVPHGVELELFAWPPAPSSSRAPTIGFVGTLDVRLDVEVLREVARAHPNWRIRLIGPVTEGFDPRALADLANVSVEPPVGHERVGATIAEFDAGLMPYMESRRFRYADTYPIKNLEFLAAGKPAVATPNRALEPFSELLYFAESPREFRAQLERALAEDSPELARRRRALAEQNAWGRRLDEIVAVAAGVAAA